MLCDEHLIFNCAKVILVFATAKIFFASSLMSERPAFNSNSNPLMRSVEIAFGQEKVLSVPSDSSFGCSGHNDLTHSSIATYCYTDESSTMHPNFQET
tara:strand:- start:115 stop:408 length:294 start_codon:yes stop_codon:yes gene_type:complete